MASPNPAGFLSSSAGARTNAVAQLLGGQSGPASAGPQGGGSSMMGGSIAVGLVVAVLFLAYWYRRIL